MSAPPPVDKVAPVAPPPQDVPVVARIAEILLAAYAIDKAAEMIAGLLLAPYKITKVAVIGVLTMLDTAHTPRSRLANYGLDARSAAAEVARRAARDDVNFRAAYIAASSARVQRALDSGKPLAEAVAAEAHNFEAHKAARDKRLDAAGRAAAATELHGWLLGWYRNPMLDSDIDCRVADGNNFDAREGTMIGYPGSVHPHCGCHAGPPHPDGGMVNAALAATLGRMSPSAATSQRLGLRRAI